MDASAFITPISTSPDVITAPDDTREGAQLSRGPMMTCEVQRGRILLRSSRISPRSEVLGCVTAMPVLRLSRA